MLKLLCCVLIVSCTASIGFRISYSLSRRARLIGQMTEALTVLQGNIRYLLLPLPRAFADLKKQFPELDVLFESCEPGEIFKSGVSALREREVIGEEEGNVLIRLSQSLGKSDEPTQLAALEEAKNSLQRLYGEARERQKKLSPLCCNVGVLSGLFIVVCII